MVIQKNKNGKRNYTQFYPVAAFIRSGRRNTTWLRESFTVNIRFFEVDHLLCATEISAHVRLETSVGQSEMLFC